MKLVVAIVRPDRVSAILEELYKAEVQGLTLSRVQGHGGEREHVETYRGMSVKMELSEKVRLEIGVSNHFVEPTVQAVLRGELTRTTGVESIDSTSNSPRRSSSRGWTDSIVAGASMSMFRLRRSPICATMPRAISPCPMVRWARETRAVNGAGGRCCAVLAGCAAG